MGFEKIHEIAKHVIKYLRHGKEWINTGFLTRVGLRRQSGSEISILSPPVYLERRLMPRFLADHSESNAPFSKPETEMKGKQEAIHGQERER